MTRVVNLRRESFDVYIGRAGNGQDGYFGNPFRMERPHAGERSRAVEKYREWFLERIERDPEFRRRVLELRDKALGCFCKPQACHGDVIVEWLEKQP
jgi:hypothetical protein